MIQQRRVMNIPAILSVRYRAPAAAAVPWWLAGGAPMPIAVYEPKGKSTLAASYVNLVNPGTYDAALGTAPTLDAAGWVMNGLAYLKTGVVPSSTFSMIARFSNGASSGDHAVAGIYGSGQANVFALFQVSANKSYYSNYADLASPTYITAGTLAVAGKSAYMNGVPDGTIGAGSVSTALDIWIGRANNQYAFTGKIQALAIWNTSTGHATWMPAVSAAVAFI